VRNEELRDEAKIIVGIAGALPVAIFIAGAVADWVRRK
jgi:hypothetical protein